MAKGTILLTGGTGFIGPAILIAALRDGYSLHIVARSMVKVDQLQTAPAILALSKALLSRCKYFVVPDFTISGSLDEAANGADFVIHCAASLPFTNIPPEKYEEEIITPSIVNVVSALESARRAGTVKRFVSLSSLGAFVAPELLSGPYIPPTELVINEASLNEEFQPPYSTILTAYCAGKTAALRRSLEWMREAKKGVHGLGFDLVNLAPTFIFGRHVLARKPEDLLATSNAMLLRSVTGNTTSDVLEFGGGYHLDDIVEAHLKDLDKDLVSTPTEGPNRSIETFTFGITVKWQDLNEMVSTKWPSEVKKGVLLNNGRFITKPNLHMDMSKVETRLGIKSKSLEVMLREVVNQYLELSDIK
ncbi:hypothetical protein JX265_012311 [Neoarthrinium moseri]|uniref:NAD-dependent epimerase/dehydratase domain-containing protein n=2 Tax=Neoarthrinium moseri TaxID=1658444 RepID=A0A9Q0AIU3_9PEZI|nr:hypothetical protein JX265_012311 [Neoarthrinium moseri]